ncbi:MAG: biotin/lipoyl-containing protein [Pseudomonadales bacterium]|jgi:acetyl/propionyl-CoA carboxylase alpha subunit|nr:biotin/lipoyl-containing protein [Pseudomonadales bacterium]MDP7357362.1 biotin/lipoyl-containing protein [Pseudomonadales bacterium]MDP7596594.1 biotin/lipoyl-containing protein [Pseudomonadales bacterium]HJN53393.1 biotin/lipoyl-containing protein [Pseudomonadales bacterium]|tara:strand:+ start:1056 stop:3911 length:2856 start_codon:yes stop_codon:yes gene_type:complete
MHASNDHYLNNPLIHRQRRLSTAQSPWQRAFSCEELKPLIICRGPIRKEAMDVFDEMGIHNYGILISEKDSFTFTNSLAPELRKLTDPSRIFRVPDYSGATREERTERIQQIIGIASQNGYDSVFAGYGFMAEDEEMVRALEDAGLCFIGPGSRTQRGAGRKDEAKRTALEVGVSVIPGCDNVTSLTLLAGYPNESALVKLCKKEGLDVKDGFLSDATVPLEDKAEAVLQASYGKGIDLFSIEELTVEIRNQVAKMAADYPASRIRLKAIFGGGGKGQRILQAASYYDGTRDEQIAAAAAQAQELVRDILSEVKCTGAGDNKNLLIELNIETTRHQEIQVVGNGVWCITMGGRDCSLQMHEQKLLEVSITVEELEDEIRRAETAGNTAQVDTLRSDLQILERMESEAARFGTAVGLNSVSTFECIVDGQDHFFMEMNTRVQVEHRVTELCYKLRFTNPDITNDYFEVESLLEAMILLACHGDKLPIPERVQRENASVEARLNATNRALRPHAGGTIEHWSNVIDGEIRDDQGISLRNPDTGVFMQYHLAGAYDSNIALLLTTGQDRLQSYGRLAEILRRTDLRGKELATNLDFHYGLVSWFIGQNIHARPETRFIVPYLTAVGKLKEAANQLDLKLCFDTIRARHLDGCKPEIQADVGGVLDRKQSLLLRPLRELFDEPHALSGWLSLNRHHFVVSADGVVLTKNPIQVLADLYHFLNMDFVAGKPAAYMIWDHDNALLQTALDFYGTLKQRLAVEQFDDLQEILRGSKPKSIPASQWNAVKASHAGFQAGTEILTVLPYIAAQTGFYDLKVNDDLMIDIPAELTVEDLQRSMSKVLVPPPELKSDELLADSGGMFYVREAPGAEPFVQEGSHFNEGDALYIVEVMKMFNKVYAPFAGTIDKILVTSDGVIIKKGQPLFKVTPDERFVHVTKDEVQAERRMKTEEFLGGIG